MGEHADKIRRMYEEVMSGGDMAVIDEVVHEDLIEHEEMPGAPSRGREAPRAFITMLRAGFPDVSVRAERIVEEGDMVAALARMTGTHEGEFMGIPATGASVDVLLMDMVRFQDGQAIEHWGLADMAALRRQLGAS
jgi:steroid delta-isomerase-like uncharacterized protein